MPLNVIDLIMTDRRGVEMIFEKLRREPENRPVLVAELAARFVAHARAEERHGAGEHHETEELRAALMAADPDRPEFGATLKRLVEAVRHHVDEGDLVGALGR
ncbi:hypothetical protein [Herbidospora cretacea]|uniref:hypothetical protein n=1 Tax=Herbidospora cretacea TaxID=28444 RepID=UPI000773339B|nr:hypothetical protein [Herbidospora cretacea]